MRGSASTSYLWRGNNEFMSAEGHWHPLKQSRCSDWTNQLFGQTRFSLWSQITDVIQTCSKITPPQPSPPTPTPTPCDWQLAVEVTWWRHLQVEIQRLRWQLAPRLLRAEAFFHFLFLLIFSVSPLSSTPIGVSCSFSHHSLEKSWGTPWNKPSVSSLLFRRF